MKKFQFSLIVLLAAWVLIGSTYSILVGTYNKLDGVYFNKALVQMNDTMNLETDKAVYHRGDTVKVRLAYCKYRQYQAETTWRIINETVITFPAKSSGVANLGCYGLDKPLWAGVVTIPDYASFGTHHIEGQSVIHVNVNDIYFNFKSQDFEVR